MPEPGLVPVRSELALVAVLAIGVGGRVSRFLFFDFFSVTRANGAETNYTYDAASPLTRLAHQLRPSTINSLASTYDKVGNRCSEGRIFTGC